MQEPLLYFGHFLGLGVFWSFFGFQGYFGKFLGLGGVLVIFWVSEVFWSFSGFREYFGHFLGSGVFWLF